jgi:hypothetical protein
MDFHRSCIAFAVGTALPKVTEWFYGNLKIMLSFFIYVYQIDEQYYWPTLAKLITENGFCSGRVLNSRHAGAPTEGWHFVWLKGPMVVYYSSGRGGSSSSCYSGYLIYAPCRATAESLQSIFAIQDTKKQIKIMYVGDENATEIRYAVLRFTPNDWQKAAIASAYKMYKQDGHAAILVCGKPGTGKTSLGILLAKHIMTETRETPTLVQNFDITKPGNSISNITVSNNRITCMTIVMLDEFDTAIKHAEGADKQSNVTKIEIIGSAKANKSHASTPASLLSFLDRFEWLPQVIVIATTNETLETMTTGAFARYTRKGRFNLHIETGVETAMGQPIVQIHDPKEYKSSSDEPESPPSETDRVHRKRE